MSYVGWKCSAASFIASALASSACLSLSFERPAQYVRKDEAKQIISVGHLTCFFSKWIVFLVFETAQQIADDKVYLFVVA
jgi:hypothetical protein